MSGAPKAALREAQRVNGTLLDRLGRACWSTASTACAQPGKRLWIQVSGTFTRVDGNRGAPDVRDDRYGFLVGADRAPFLSAQRDFGSFGRTHGTGHAHEFNAGLQVSLPWTFSATAAEAWTLTPRVGLRYAHVDGLGLSESGLASQSLSVGDQRLNSLQPYAGLALDYAFATHDSTRLAHVGVQVGYAYETHRENHDVSVTSGDGTGFVIPGTRDTRGLTTAGLEVDMPLGKAARLYARYDAVLPTGNVRAQDVQAGVSYRF